ncbi:MAG: recombinase zinc beta ribbon domain-containing protein [Henriciella sp.]|nr:recombinase zinc beta ribbon domain-containing protein [Henriciella sp.]MBO6695130.1 recombinase zinc beta ribbon domain-containing protein [Henriciella sp.]
MLYEPWGVSLRKGRHPALISYETHLKIQDRLAGRSHAPQRANSGEDFALRGFVTCGDCDAPLYSSFSRGRSKRYPYYLCGTKGCESYGKSIRRDDLEGEFETLLKSLQPSRTLVELVGAMIKDIFEQNTVSQRALAASIKKELNQADQQISGLVDRVVQAESPTLISAYEARITELEKRKAQLGEQLETRTTPKGSLKSKTRTALAFLANPCEIWRNGRYEDRRAVLKLSFCGQIPYKRGSGFRTVEKEKISLPFRLLGDSRVPKCGVVGPEGLEPPTRPL